MKLIDGVITTALPCAASVQVHAAGANDQPVLLAQAHTSLRPTEGRAPAMAQDAGHRGAQAAAAKGPEVLRRCIDRTRMIHALQYADFVGE